MFYFQIDNINKSTFLINTLNPNFAKAIDFALCHKLHVSKPLKKGEIHIVGNNV